MTTAYDIGRSSALSELGLVKTATPAPVAVRQRKDPFTELHRKIQKAFKLKMPKFDLTAHMKRLMNNPLKQPRLHLSGKGPAVKM